MARNDAAKVVGGKFENCDPSALEVLLVANVLITGDEQVEFGLRLLNQLAVFYRMPTAFLGSGACMPNDEFVHRPGDALVEEDFHAAAKSADYEHS